MGNKINKKMQAMLKEFAGIELPEEQINEPASNALAISEIIAQETEYLSMDAEPGNFTKLLHDLAPTKLKENEKNHEQ